MDNISPEEVTSVISIEALLLDLGCKNIHDRGHYYSASSPFREDKNPSFALYKDNLIWKDWGGEHSGGNLDTLVRLIKHESLREYLGISRDQTMKKLWTTKRKDTQTFLSTEEYNPKDYDLIIEGSGINYDLRTNYAFYNYAKLIRHMDDDFIKYFNVGYSIKSKIYLQKKENYISDPVKTIFENRLCIPIIESGIFASVEGRRIDGEKEFKCIYPSAVGGAGGSRYRRLFNIDNLDYDKPLVVCEGIMDIPQIWSHITHNVTCTFGSALKEQHKKDLNKFKDIIVFSDTDEGGEHMIDFIYRNLTEKEVRVARLKKEGADPGSATLEELEEALNNTMSATKYILKRDGVL